MERTPSYRIQKAYTEEGTDGWDLFEDGQWAQRFTTRREARDAKKDLIQGEGPMTDEKRA